jgi:hypothetical protein
MAIRITSWSISHLKMFGCSFVYRSAVLTETKKDCETFRAQKHESLGNEPIVYGNTIKLLFLNLF